MLATNHRLKGKNNFDRVKTEGRLYQKESFGALVLKRDNDGPSRFGFVVSTKVSSHATQRNRIKRALSEAVRYNLDKIGKGYDVVFLAKTPAARMSTDDIMREVIVFLREAGFKSSSV